LLLGWGSQRENGAESGDGYRRKKAMRVADGLRSQSKCSEFQFSNVTCATLCTASLWFLFLLSQNSNVMWRGEQPVEDFGRFMSVVLLDLLTQEVDCILVDMNQTLVATATKLLALKEKKEKKAARILKAG
jgi:hypothetical protein